MYISKTRFINWTRCPMYFPMDLMHNPTGKDDIDAERERREEMMKELMAAISGEHEDDEEFDAAAGPELEALLPYYNQVEAEALKVANRLFRGDFVADFKNVQNQKLFEYKRNAHTYRCYVDIYNENDEEINIFEVKATTNSKFTKIEFSDAAPRKRGNKFGLFTKQGNIWRLNIEASNTTPEALQNYNSKIENLLNRFKDEGKYPYDVAFQRFVIEHALKEKGDQRRVNFYLAVLNSEYVYDGARDDEGNRIYNEIDGQEVVTFIDMNEVSEMYQPLIMKEIAKLESYVATPHGTEHKVPVGEWCAWGKNTQCTFCKHCFHTLRNVPEYNKANNYLSFRGFPEGNIANKYQLINEGYWKFDDVPTGWLKSENHLIQRECYDSETEYVDTEKMQHWFDSQLEFPVYHFDFESFPCPLPRFKGENPYRQSVFEFSLHIEREAGLCDKEADNIIFLNDNCDDDEREALVEAIISNFEFNNDGSLKGTMLAQNTSFEIGRLKELAEIYPKHKAKLLAICEKSADLIHLLKTKEDIYKDVFDKERAKAINYYHKNLSGSYSIKKTLPVLVPSLTYKGMDVGNGVQAYIAYLNYDSAEPTFGVMKTKAERRAALSRYCQQDTWAMVEILRAVRNKIG